MRTTGVLLLLTLLTTSARAVDYYVSTSGSNSNSGTLARPFRTIQQAAALAQAGDNVYVRGGTYRESVSVMHSGSAGSPITFQPYAGEAVTITGLDLLTTKWSQYSGATYTTAFPAGVSQVFVDGRMMTEARWPNNGYNNPLRAGFSTVEAANIQQSPALSTITDSKLGNPASGYWNGAKMGMAAGSEWVFTGPTKIVSQTSNNLNFQTQIQPAEYTPTAGNPYFLYGTLNALDAPKEWHYEPSATVPRLYLQAPDSTSPANHTVEVRTRQVGLDLGNQSYVNVSGFRIVAGSVNVAGDHNTLHNNQVLYPTPLTLGNGYHPPGGIAITGNYNTVSQSEIAYTWGAGVKIDGAQNTINNNIIHDVDWGAQQGGFIKLGDENNDQSGNSITNNSMYNAGRDGINLGNSLANTQILHNNISRFGYLVRDLGGIYSVSANAPGSVVAYNRISDNRSAGENVGIYIDYSTSGITAHNNLVTDTQIGAVVNSPGADINVYNNTLWNVQQAMSTYGPGEVLTNVKTYNNLSNDNQWAGNDIQNNRYQTVNQFANSAAGDYTLTANSSGSNQGPTFKRAVDYGRVISGITDGYTGAAPDAGAFESGIAPWTSGANWTTWLAANQASAPLTTALHVTSANARFKTTSLVVDQDQRAFMKFDLSNIANQPIQQAVLRIYENTPQDLENAGNLTLSRVTSNWTDASVTFTQSKTDLSSSFYDPSNVDYYTDIDVTATVLAWLASPATNFGFSLQGSGATKYFDGFYGITAPQLMITVGPALVGDYNGDGFVDAADYVLWCKINDNFLAAQAAVPEPCAVGLVGAFLICLPGYRRRPRI